MNSRFDKSSKVKHLGNEKQVRFLKGKREWTHSSTGQERGGDWRWGRELQKAGETPFYPDLLRTI